MEGVFYHFCVTAREIAGSPNFSHKYVKLHVHVHDIEQVDQDI